MKHACFFIVLCGLHFFTRAQTGSLVSSFYIPDSVKVTIDRPAYFKKNKPVVIIFYALPNGNTTVQTMGKAMKAGDDWHFDIQHIAAQTRFIRASVKQKNFVVIYLENHLKSWPAWKQRHPDFRILIPHMIDSLAGMIAGKKKEIYLNGHSGGGSWIFGYLNGVENIPPMIKRISFLDSDYGYDSSYYPKLKKWLTEVKGAALNVFAYNDSVALYNGKPVVSATGGTWYRSRLLLQHLQQDFSFRQVRDDSLVVYETERKNIGFFFKTNPDRKIFHTTQVELNGFIHSILFGTRYEAKGYEYYGRRAYGDLIE